MTIPQIISLLAAAGVAIMYIWPLLPAAPSISAEPAMLAHLRSIMAVRDAYKSPEVAEKCNALMEVLLGIKQ